MTHQIVDSLSTFNKRHDNYLNKHFIIFYLHTRPSAYSSLTSVHLSTQSSSPCQQPYTSPLFFKSIPQHTGLPSIGSTAQQNPKSGVVLPSFGLKIL